MKIYILRQLDKQMKFICDGGKTEIDDEGNIVITQKMTPAEIADFFDVPVSDVLSDNLKVGMYTYEED